MNFRTTLVLLLVLGVVAGVFLFTQPRQDALREAAVDATGDQERTPLLTDVSAEDAVRLRVERVGLPTLVLARSMEEGTRTDWRLVEPVSAAAEQWRVDSLVRDVVGVSSLAAAASGVTADDAGLTPPEAVVELTMSDGAEHAIEIGRPVALSEDVYGRLAGESQIYVLERRLADATRRDVTEFRTRDLLEVDAARVRRFEIGADGRRYAFERGGVGDAWRILAPVRTRANGTEVRTLLNEIGRLTIERFADEDRNSPAVRFDEPYMTLTLVSDAPAPLAVDPNMAPTGPMVREQTLTVGGPADLGRTQRFVRVNARDEVLIVSASSLDELKPELGELRASEVVGVTAEAINAITLQSGGERVELVRDDASGRWNSVDAAQPVDQDVLAEMTGAIANLRAIDYVDDVEDLAAYGLEAPRAELEVRAIGRPTPLQLRIGAVTASERNAFAQRGDEPTVYVVNANLVNTLAVEPVTLRSRDMLTFDPARLERMRIVRRDGAYALVRDDGGWRFADRDAPVDSESVPTLVTTLSRLRAAGIEGSQDAEAYGLAEAPITVELTLEDSAGDGTVTRRVALGFTSEGAFARVDDEPLIYRLDPTAPPVFQAEFVERKLFDFGGDDIVEVVVEAPGGVNHLAREGDGWVFPPDPYVQLSTSRVETFVDELADLRADRILAWSGADLAQSGLAETPATARITLRDGGVITLNLDQVQRGGLPRRAAWVEQQRVVLLRFSDAERLMQSVDAFIREAAPEEPSPAAPGMPPAGMPPGMLPSPG